MYNKKSNVKILNLNDKDNLLLTCGTIYFSSLILFFFYRSFPVSSTGAITYSEVRAFLQKQPNIITKYKSITTLGNKIITLTGNHLIYGRKGCVDQIGPM